MQVTNAAQHAEPVTTTAAPGCTAFFSHRAKLYLGLFQDLFGLFQDLDLD